MVLSYLGRDNVIKGVLVSERNKKEGQYQGR